MNNPNDNLSNMFEVGTSGINNNNSSTLYNINKQKDDDPFGHSIDNGISSCGITIDLPSFIMNKIEETEVQNVEEMSSDSSLSSEDDD